MDHERILKIATTELERVADAGAAADAGRGGGGGNTTRSLQQGGRDWHKPAAATLQSPTTTTPTTTPPPTQIIDIDSGVIHKLAEAFHFHAEHFDALYQAKIPASAY